MKGFNTSLIFAARGADDSGSADQTQQLEAAALNRAQEQGSI
ncbi:hypothetical protein [Parasedimentitalea psychrophila]|uniref:Uncharacterized protein n=1 Tax=Parasedimentitalea psychrophila TaxID=2997337 RepID=A0A9Y2L1M9_9RHOB|nr:hypothetical protein [Parasedimentitalea psychrophila]WIY27056.1 hypothetical protein QPJ95_09120 [Parasedimentitalea psychrophila]